MVGGGWKVLSGGKVGFSLRCSGAALGPSGVETATSRGMSFPFSLRCRSGKEVTTTGTF